MMTLRAFAPALAVLAWSALPAAQQTKTSNPSRLGIVEVTGGKISGVSAGGGSISAFKGIPFAAPPVGNLRWRAPQPAAKWDGVRQAAQFAQSCVQGGGRGAGINQRRLSAGQAHEDAGAMRHVEGDDRPRVSRGMVPDLKLEGDLDAAIKTDGE